MTSAVAEGLTAFRRGKVRDTFDLGHGSLLMVATDRISAFPPWRRAEGARAGTTRGARLPASAAATGAGGAGGAPRGSSGQAPGPGGGAGPILGATRLAAALAAAGLALTTGGFAPAPPGS